MTHSVQQHTKQLTHSTRRRSALCPASGVCSKVSSALTPSLPLFNVIVDPRRHSSDSEPDVGTKAV